MCLALASGWSVGPRVGAAQASGNTACPVLCAPSLTAFPALNRSPIAGAPRVQRLSDGAVHRLAGTSNLQLTLVGSVRTAVPRLGLLGSVQWTPYATERGNPFLTSSPASLSLTASTP